MVIKSSVAIKTIIKNWLKMSLAKFLGKILQKHYKNKCNTNKFKK